MPRKDIGSYSFGAIYPLYVQKAEKKGRSREELDTIIRWLTGYEASGLAEQVEKGATMRTFFEEAPRLHPNCHLITGVVCGVRVETIDDPLTRKIRYLDKLIDELARGKAMEKILRR